MQVFDSIPVYQNVSKCIIKWFVIREQPSEVFYKSALLKIFAIFAKASMFHRSEVSQFY